MPEERGGDEGAKTPDRAAQDRATVRKRPKLTGLKITGEQNENGKRGGKGL